MPGASTEYPPGAFTPILGHFPLHENEATGRRRGVRRPAARLLRAPGRRLKRPIPPGSRQRDFRKPSPRAISAGRPHATDTPTGWHQSASGRELRVLRAAYSRSPAALRAPLEAGKRPRPTPEMKLRKTPTGATRPASRRYSA
jgi:hypothetical protein